MLDVQSKDRLQPSLLDRLTDHQPGNSRENPEERVLTRQMLRAAVLRDLSWLFNATRPEPEPASTRRKEAELWRAALVAFALTAVFAAPSNAQVAKGLVDPNTASEADLLALPHMTPAIVKGLIE